MPRHHLLAAAVAAFAAVASPQTQVSGPSGSVEVSARVKIEGKVEKLTRKRFFLFKGGLKDNEAVVSRIKSAEFESRDCFYTRMKASKEFVCWLESENCESPYCRKIQKSDLALVPEFKAAFDKGLLAFGKREDVALGWLPTNLPRTLTSGFNASQNSQLSKITEGSKPVQSSMTDSVTVKAVFIDIPVTPPAGKKSETYTIANVIPIEVGKRSYSWACELEVQADKTAAYVLRLPEGDKPVKGCEVVVRDLKSCKTGDCTAKK